MNATFLQLLNLEYVEHIKNIPKSNIISTLISYNAARIITIKNCWINVLIMDISQTM